MPNPNHAARLRTLHQFSHGLRDERPELAVSEETADALLAGAEALELVEWLDAVGKANTSNWMRVRQAWAKDDTGKSYVDIARRMWREEAE